MTMFLLDDLTVRELGGGDALVELRVDGITVGLGHVRRRDDRWYWQHADGERSSAFSPTRWAATSALVDYHRRFKQV